MDSVELRVDNGARITTDLTDQVRNFCHGRGDGLLSVFVPHATAGVVLMETGSGSEQDLAAVLSDVLPVEDRYRHRHGSLGHGRDHVLPAFIAPSLTVPVFDGRPALGTWQSVVLVDTNGDNPSRRIRLSFLAG
ncbi:MAG: secondary thiamine-phosphate synthase enzyme YjbQ [bacterium]